jgi:glycerophosphoryl diester phosphodiesterase
VADIPELAHLRTTKEVFASVGPETDWFVDDLSLAEVRLLRARQRVPTRSQEWNDLYAVPTLHEVLDWLRAKNEEQGRVVGMYIETKDAEYYTRIGRPMESALLDTLRAAGWANPDTAPAPVILGRQNA